MTNAVTHLPKKPTTKAPGHVTLVGAGPGEPDLLTLKAAKAIAAADALFVDDLVNPQVLEHASATARVVYVGKRGGCASTPQSFIIKAMIAAASNGEQVVRLKGGDPFIFGRGGEEVEALQAAGVGVSAVNGITSGLAALSGLNVSLTHREHAQGVVFVTGHAKPGGAGTDWEALSRTAHQAKLTLVIYMGVTNAQDIEAGLLQGLPTHTAVALIQNATLPSQRHAVGTLATLTSTMRINNIASPAIMVVGDVVQGLLAAQLTAAQDPPMGIQKVA
ncbi:uroporphyrinogen-III C-methyltransferase [Comamonadaceae bacterium M7527]|nr:uroporphyrinogen-III C-methyltransferase [Comamonadaceae bacterium M7527]